MRDTYELGMGELVVDLRQTDLPSGDVPVTIDLGIGDARLIVPDDVCVATDAQVGIGEARTFDRHNEGVDIDVADLPERLTRDHPAAGEGRRGHRLAADRQVVHQSELRQRRI